MKYTLYLIFFLLILSFHSYAQVPTPQIISQWRQLTSVIQRRSKVIITLTKQLSFSRVDKNQNDKLNRVAVELYKYLDSYHIPDSVTVNITAAKNKNLLENLRVTFREIEEHREITSKPQFASIQGKLEGCENGVINATREYNDMCRQFARTDLMFISGLQK